MFTQFVSGLLIAVGAAAPVPAPPSPDADNLPQPAIKKIEIPQPTLLLISDSGRQAPGPDHGAYPNRENHDYGLPANAAPDPYAGSLPSDPYGGSQGWYTNPYAGSQPY